MPQFIQFLAHTIRNDPSLGHHERRVGLDLPRYAVTHLLAENQLGAQCPQRVVVTLHESLLDRHDGLECDAQLLHVARRDTSRTHLGRDAFQVSHLLQLFIDQFAEVRMTEETVHHILPARDGPHVLEGESEPSAQGASSHRRDGMVDDVKERTASPAHGFKEFEAAQRELVHVDETLLLDAADARDVLQVRMLRHLQVLQHHPGSHNAALEVVYAESLETLHLEMAQELLRSRALGEAPVVEFEGDVARTEAALELILLAAFVQHLLGHEVAQQLIDILCRALCRHELSRADVEQGQSARPLAEMYGS